MYKSSLLIILLFMFGCTEHQESEDSQVKAQNNCGIVNSDPIDEGFWFRCGSEENLLSIDNVENKSYKKEQICDVYYSDNGQPKQFNCVDKPTEFSTYFAQNLSFYGHWSCTGLDGHGGYDQKKLSTLNLSEDGTFSIALTAKETTDNIWFVADSLISGDYSANTTNKLRLDPQTWESNVINQTNLTISDAPKFMIVSPSYFAIKTLSANSMTIGFSFIDESLGRSHKINCERIN